MTNRHFARLAGALATGLLLLQAAAASAATIQVPFDYPDIQAAVDAAAEGDEIVVAPGTYGPVFILYKTVTIRSSAGPQVTFIDCGGSTTTGVYSNGAYSGPNYPVILEGFTITQCGNGFHTHYSGGNVVRDCVITGNQGSGMYLSAFAGVLVERTVITDNHAGWNGGGIQGYSVFVNVVDSVIERNSAVRDGGGIDAQGMSGITLTRSAVRENVALGFFDEEAGSWVGGHGGGINVTGNWGPSVTLTSSIVAGNQATTGGAAFVGAGSLNVNASTVTGNAAATSGGIHVEPGGGIRVQDSIVYFNGATPPLPDGAATFSDVEGGAVGTGNIDEDPLFVDAASGDYSLSEASPCRDAGWGVVDFDFPNNCRPLGTGYDIGAHELVPAGSDADGDGYLVCADCNDADPSTNPGAAEACDGVDNDCNGQVDEGFDADGDGYASCFDCNDADPSVNPGSAEIVRDGVDQDCNGYDLTIVVRRAEWKAKQRTLYVEAASLLGAQAALVLPDYGVAMTWNRSSSLWTARVAGPIDYPGTVNVSGSEGLVTAGVAVK